jgi:predicted nucleotidyltransferase component of viral defense system
MIDKETLLQIKKYEQPYQAEKDYLQELFLYMLYKELGDSLIFKGGTAISKFYGSVRFSDDLDFSIYRKGSRPESIIKKLNLVIGKISNEYPTIVLRKKIKKVSAFEISIRGPFFEIYNKYQHLKIEVDNKVAVYEAANIVRRNPVYPDIMPYIAVVMSEREILAEKVVALMFRHNLKARDLFDLYFLIDKNTRVDVNLIDKKMKEHGHTFHEEKLIKSVEIIGKIWDAELDRLIPKEHMITFQRAKKTVFKQFTIAGLL